VVKMEDDVRRLIVPQRTNIVPHPHAAAVLFGETEVLAKVGSAALTFFGGGQARVMRSRVPSVSAAAPKTLSSVMRRRAPNEAEGRSPSPLVMEAALFYPVVCMAAAVFQDDLLSISVSRLRASGAITAEMTRTMIGIADVEVEVGLQLVRFANGGSWSFCLCPSCGLPGAGA
jgi:hypothetical protein